MSVRVGDQLLGLGDEHGGEQGGVDVLEGAAQPHVEEVREVGVADIVVVRRIRGDDGVPVVTRCRVGLKDARRDTRRRATHCFRNSLDHDRQTARRTCERVAFSEIPRHRQSLSGEHITEDLHLRVVGPRIQSRRIVREPRNGKSQIRHHCIRIGCRTDTSRFEALPLAHPAGKSVPQHPLTRLTHQIREGGQRRQLPRREEFVKGIHPIHGSREPARVFSNTPHWDIRLRLHHSHIDLIPSRRKIDSLAITFHSHSHHLRTHTAITATFSN